MIHILTKRAISEIDIVIKRKSRTNIAGGGMRFSEYFNLPKKQAVLDFVDIPLDTDVPVFLEPVAIKSLRSTWGHELASMLQTFFSQVLKHIRSGNDDKAKALLASLNESNEFHLGYSSGRSRGHGFGTGSAEDVWSALTESKASVTGLLKDLEDTALLIPGVGSDMISDAVCNILRGPLIRYTQDMCSHYGVPLTSGVESGPIWNPREGRWDHALVSLPMTSYGKIILVPKLLVRSRLCYRSDEYYRYFILPQMQHEHLQARTPLVEVLKSGEERVTKKVLMEKYGKDKLAVAEQSVARPYILDEYREQKKNSPSTPLTQEQLYELEGQGAQRPDLFSIADKLRRIPTGGGKIATDYENAIEEIFSILFYPSLCNPKREEEIHDGRKRIDIRYINEAKKGFFFWLSLHYSAMTVVVECKNYGKELGNPELDQISGRFSPSRGQVGILVCRSLQNKEAMYQRCVDTAKDNRGYVIVLEDSDVFELMEEYENNELDQEYKKLMSMWKRLID